MTAGVTCLGRVPRARPTPRGFARRRGGKGIGEAGVSDHRSIP